MAHEVLSFTSLAVVAICWPTLMMFLEHKFGMLLQCVVSFFQNKTTFRHWFEWATCCWGEMELVEFAKRQIRNVAQRPCTRSQGMSQSGLDSPQNDCAVLHISVSSLLWATLNHQYRTHQSSTQCTLLVTISWSWYSFSIFKVWKNNLALQLSTVSTYQLAASCSC